jgi:hypothetical protein
VSRGLDNPPVSRALTLGRVAKRLLLIALVAIAGGELAYVVAINVFLSTPLFERLVDATPKDVDIHFARAWSLLPGRVHAEGLSISGTDSHVEWVLRIDEIDFGCSLLELPRQVFHATWARGRGISFRIRLKPEAPAATPENLRDLPVIADLGAIPFVPDETPYPGLWDDAKWHLWRVRLDDVVADRVREVWFQKERFEGDARIAGSFRLKPMREVEVGPVHVDVRSGRVNTGGRTLVEPLATSVDFTLASFDPRTASSSDILRNVTLSVDARAELPDVGDLALNLPRSGQVRGRVEVPRLAVRLSRGALENGSHLDAHVANLLATDASHAVSGELSVTADVQDGKLSAEAHVERCDGDFVAHAPTISLAIESRSLGLDSPLRDVQGVLDLPELDVPHAADLQSYLPTSAPARIDGGSAKAALHVEASRPAKTIAGKITLLGHELAIVAGKVSGRGDVRADLVVEKLDLGRKSIAGRADVVLADVAGGFAPGAQAFAVDHLDAHVSAGRLLLAKPSLEALDLALRIRGGRIDDVRSLRAFLPGSSKLRIDSGRVLISADVASSGASHGLGGEIELSLVGGSVDWDKTHVAGDIDVRAYLKSFREKTSELDLEGSRVALRNVRVDGSSTDTKAWNGDIVLPSGILALSSKPTFDGTIAVRARDARPLLAFLFRDSLPKIIGPLTDMPELTATMRVAVGSGDVEMSGLRAGGGDLSVRGTYAVRSGDGRGAFVVQKGPVSVGVNLDEAGAHVRFFDLDQWYGDLSRQAVLPR